MKIEESTYFKLADYSYRNKRIYGHNNGTDKYMVAGSTGIGPNISDLHLCNKDWGTTGIEHHPVEILLEEVMDEFQKLRDSGVTKEDILLFIKKQIEDYVPGPSIWREKNLDAWKIYLDCVFAPLDQVPLFINDPDCSYIAIGRLKIAR